MVLLSTSVLMVEWAPQNDCHQCLCPQGESKMPPASPGGSPRSASGSGLGSFQITASALGLRASEILHAPPRNGVSVSYNPPAFLYTIPAGLQIKTLWGAHLPSIGPSGWGAQ